MEPIALELKYCELCGSLTLRRSHSSETYCARCHDALNTYLLPGQVGRLHPRASTHPAPTAASVVTMPGRFE